ncbi:hypothetical protein EJ03DRAFT_338289 [Teratosphaeria nubilosa]|uniref:Uncharacterized protein n=1 Tax=Teratosphaeria nubilosa TaxID=161662 RepID=A0A6G1L110_9PEZI|nr:hypothetical protein EJ03DRAFT_338289 [Teratosphaeria nubilosa]
MLLRTISWTLSFTLILLLQTTTALFPTRKRYEYPSARSWLENIAVRQNGDLLLTSVQVPGGVSSLNPLINGSKPVHFASPAQLNNHSALGIVETTADTFYVVVVDYNLDTAAIGVNWIYKLIFPDGRPGSLPSVEVFLEMPAAGLLHGELMAAGQIIGINGVHYQHDMLHFTNSDKGLYASLLLDEHAAPIGKAIPIGDGNAFLATQAGHTVQDVPHSRGDASIVAGGLNSTAIGGLTSAAFGRTDEDRDVLYTVSAGTGFGVAYPVPTWLHHVAAQEGIREVFRARKKSSAHEKKP